MLHLLRSCVFCLSVSVFLVTLFAYTASACPDLASAPHSQWKLEVHDGVSWLITPCGERFLSIGVNVVNGGYPSRHFKSRLSYHWGAFYPDLTSWAKATRQRLEAWGFNTIGAWSLKPAQVPLSAMPKRELEGYSYVLPTQLPLPFIPNLGLEGESSFLWADPFRPTMEKELRTWARRLVAPYKNNPYRIGYFSDNEIGWWNSALFTVYLDKPATNYTKQKLLALVREHYANDWQRFTQDFVPPAGVSSFSQLLKKRSLNTRLRPGSEGMQVIRRWTSIMAEHYYRLLQRALREADPQALFFGDRLQIYYDPDVMLAMAPYVDAIATNYDVDDQNGNIAHYYFDGLQKLTGNKPVLVSEWFFAAHENRSGNLNKGNGYYVMVQTQAERARGAITAAQEFVKMPQIIGLHWFQYYDHPLGDAEMVRTIILA